MNGTQKATAAMWIVSMAAWLGAGGAAARQAARRLEGRGQVMTRAILPRTRRVAAPVLAIALPASAAAPALAQRREVRNTTRTNLNQNRNVNRNVNDRRNPNVNINDRRNTNINVNRNTNVNVNVNSRGGYYGGVYYDRGPSVAGVVAATVATAIVVGSIVNSLPPSCSTVIVNGFAYQNCGGTYYQPRYQGSSVTYIVVNHP